MLSRGSLNSLHVGIAVGIQREYDKTPDDRLSTISVNDPSAFDDIVNANNNFSTRSDYSIGDDSAIQTIESTDEVFENNARYATSASTTHETYKSKDMSSHENYQSEDEDKLYLSLIEETKSKDATDKTHLVKKNSLLSSEFSSLQGKSHEFPTKLSPAARYLKSSPKMYPPPISTKSTISAENQDYNLNPSSEDVPSMQAEETTLPSDLKNERKSTNTTVIMIAIFCGVGGCVAAVLLVILYCAYRRGKRVDRAQTFVTYQGEESIPIEEIEVDENIIISKTPAYPFFLINHVKSNRREKTMVTTKRDEQLVKSAAVLDPALLQGHQVANVYGRMAPLGSGAIAEKYIKAKTMVTQPKINNGIEIEKGNITDQHVDSNDIKKVHQPAITLKGKCKMINAELNDYGLPAAVANTPVHEVDFQDIKFIKKISQGSLGSVHEGILNGNPVAIKLLADESSALENKIIHSTANNVKLREKARWLSRLRHPNIVEFLGVCIVPPCIITELCENGSLSDVLRACRQNTSGMGEKLTWSQRISMALDSANGILHLHAGRPSIIHQDLKSSNLLVDSQFRVKVADINLNSLIDKNLCIGGSEVSKSPQWLAPEILAGETATESSDAFSFAVILWELLTWRVPWGEEIPWKITRAVENGARLEIPSTWDLPGGQDTIEFASLDGGLESYIDLLIKCWSQNPLDRPKFCYIVQELNRILVNTQEWSNYNAASKSGTNILATKQLKAYTERSSLAHKEEEPTSSINSMSVAVSMDIAFENPEEWAIHRS